MLPTTRDGYIAAITACIWDRIDANTRRMVATPSNGNPWNAKPTKTPKTTQQAIDAVVARARRRAA